LQFEKENDLSTSPDAERRYLTWLGILTALAGCIVIGVLVEDPSQSGGFLGFSTGRWLILLVNILALAAVLLGVYKVRTNQAKRLETWIAQQRHLYWLFFLSIVLLFSSLPAGMGWIPAVRNLAYFGRLQPTLLWLAFVNGLVTLATSYILRQSIWQWISQFIPLVTTAKETTPLTRAQRLIMVSVSIVYLALQLASHLQVREAEWLPDSIDYIFPATNYNWNEPGLWMHTKPWGAAVLYKITGSSPVAIDAAQTAFSALAWLTLAWIFSRFVQSGWLKIALIFVILGCSLTPAVQMWNHIIQSEALSISLMVLILAVWGLLLWNWRWKTLFILLFLLAWWIGVRETNVYLGLIIAGMLALVGLFYKQHRFYWVVSALLIWFSLLNLQISEMPTLPRWLYPLTNTLLHRILPEEQFIQYFEMRGMPVTPELLALSGGYANSEGFAVFNNGALDDMERWLYKRGKDVYIHFLLDHPVYTLLSPWQNVGALLAPDDLQSYAPQKYTPQLAWLFGSLVYPGSLWLVAFLALAALIAALTADPGRVPSVFWLVAGFLLLFFPHFYLVWHGDAAEVGRHAIQASIQVRLGLWLCLLLSLDTIYGYGLRTRHRS